VTAAGRYLLDTSALIDVSKEIEPTSSQVRRWLTGSSEVGTCGVVVAEFFAGLSANERSMWMPLIDRLAFWETTRRSAVLAGIYRYQFARLGKALSTPDTIIAAIAVNVGATLVTRNVKDFPMSDLSVLDLAM
jgi:predicted nucleic acid-binding protein